MRLSCGIAAICAIPYVRGGGAGMCFLFWLALIGRCFLGNAGCVALGWLVLAGERERATEAARRGEVGGRLALWLVSP